MRILVLGTQLSNIGNGIISRGAVAAVKRAFPDAEVIHSSAFSYYLADVAVENGGDERLRRNSVAVGDFLEPDVALFSGCILYPHPLRRHLPLLKRLDREGIPIGFLGVGGNDYEAETVSMVTDFLSKIDPEILTTRDQAAYDAYSDAFAEATLGIDNGFFISDWYDPPEADIEFVVATLDKTEYDVPDTEHPIVRPHHAPFDLLRDVYEGAGVIGGGLKLGRQVFSPNELENAYDALGEGNLFVSDNIKDYLFFYKNAARTYTDRVHAAVPALVYGNQVKFSYNTPRAKLFNGVVEEQDRFYRIAEDETKNRRKRQIEYVRKLSNYI